MNVVITPDNLKYDGYDSIREYFNDEQWEIIYDSIISESVCVPEDDTEKYNIILRKIREVFDITGEIDR
tara:strand:- start:2827 stop:3033 length:207 start_codon:yes stop_codon:yes gene_type:complete